MPTARWLVLLLIFVTAGCRKSVNFHENSFYYWKTTFNLQDTSVKNEIKKLGVHHFYVRFFDVDWSESYKMPVPKGEIEPDMYQSARFLSGNFTPVLFITNTTFERMPASWSDSLAHKLTKKWKAMEAVINRTNAIGILKDSLTFGSNSWHAQEDSEIDKTIMQLDSGITEIQIDCDWTEATRDAYFRFLKQFRALNPGRQVSVTVRLFPYKYRGKMGVPPVDRGMLMCYNLGNIRKETTTNSIFSLNELKKYMDAGHYPLPLDIALPVFSWQVWFRDGNFKGIVHNKITTDDTTAFMSSGNHVARFKVDTVIDDSYYREGDELRLESPDEKELLLGASMIIYKIPDYRRLAFFDWNDSSINRYEPVIQSIFHTN